MGFEPTRPKAGDLESVFIFEKKKEEWIEWCKRESPSSVNRYKRYLERYLTKEIFTPDELRALIEMHELLNNRHALMAIRNYIRFLEKKGYLRRSEADDFRAVIPCVHTNARAESDKAVTAEEIIKSYKCIYGEGKQLDAKRLYFKMLLFTGLRGTEVLTLLNEFDPEVLDRTIEAFSFQQFKRVAVYDLETISINTRKHRTKRGYIAIFPKILVNEIVNLQDIEFKESLVRKSRMFACPDAVDLPLLRKFHYNWFMDHASEVPDMPADVYRVIEFMQGRTHKEVGGRNYRANVQVAVRLYDALINKYIEQFKSII